jgi:general secretion pathway protein F
MNYDEFAFFNQQLAGMLRDGIPLEGALKQLAAGMRRGPLRSEVELLESDLARGTPLKDALAKRSLPEFYVRMLDVGVRGNDLPGALTMLADHYHRTNATWTRLKGLMVYPVLVILVSLGLTLLLSVAFSKMQSAFSGEFFAPHAPFFALSIWMPPLFLAVTVVLGVLAISTPRVRAWLRWHLPGFREASLAQFASTMVLLLKSGTPLVEALALAEGIEGASPAGKALSHWRSLAQAGKGKPIYWSSAATPFPPLFLWLVQKSGEELAAGFQKAAELYHARAAYRIELALYGALPISILILGQMVLWQATPVFRFVVLMLNSIGAFGDGGFKGD